MFKTMLYGFTGLDHAYACVKYIGLSETEDDLNNVYATAYRMIEQNPSIREVIGITWRPGLKKEYEESKRGMAEQVIFHTDMQREGHRLV